MGRTKQRSKKASKAEAHAATTPAPSTSAQQPASITVEDLLVQSAELIASLNYDGAKQHCLHAIELATRVAQDKPEEADPRMLRDALEILGTIELELSEIDEAREHFALSIQLASSLADPSPAPHLYLAQISQTPQESLAHFGAALAILQDKLAAMEQAKLGGDGGAGAQEDAEDEGEIRRSASRALVGMTELYLTDLCFEPEAEQNCEKYLAQAAEIDPTDPEVYQTLASVRLSQQREEDAKAALNQGWELWRNLEAESALYPPAASRLACAKLFLELGVHVAALEILHQLEGEDDENPEVWYLSGWAWWLLGESRAETPATEDEESQGECWSEAKLCLQNYLTLEERDPSETDAEQMKHVQELLGKLDAAGVVASVGAAEGDAEWEDASEDEAMEESKRCTRAMSLFKKKRTVGKLSFGPDPAASSQPSLLSPIARTASAPVPPSPGLSLHEHPQHIDDFGRPISQPAFAAAGAGAAPFGHGYGIGEDADLQQPAEMQLLYGYAPLSTTLELSVIKVDRIVAACADEIRRRGLDTPLIMSSMALDISLDGVCSLIRSYLDEPTGWAQDLALAHPLSVGAFMKWGLARLINERGRRGFVSWDSYEGFRSAERASNYVPKACSLHLISRLSASNGRLLFVHIRPSDAANGMPPRKLASLFSPYVFGLADDRSFDETYQEWQRASDALEHILLSFIRDQQANAPLPTFLERFTSGYPDTLNISYSNGPCKVPKGARLEEVTRVKRLTRFHSRNLIQQGGTWDVPHSNDWKLFFAPGVTALSSSTSSTASGTAAPDRPVYTPSYRHLLNIRSSHGLIDDDDEGFLQRYKTAVEKEWAKFGEIGFTDVDSTKLEFDLTEGEREAVKRKRDTMDWSTFESAGFSHEVFAPGHLVFHHTLNQRVSTWPSSAKAIDQRLRQAEQALPPFPYDTTPREEGRIAVDATFFEAWADVLVGGGWARDELKESSFALIQWKARPRDGDLSRVKPGGDPRTEERWVLVEEFVPREYREALLADPKVKKESRRISFMRAVRRKSSFAKDSVPSATPPRAPPVSSASAFGGLMAAPLSSSYTRKESTLRPIDEAVFDPNNDAETKLMTLSNLHLAPESAYGPSSTVLGYGPPSASRYAPSTAYAPSVVSTVRAADGHGPASSSTDLVDEYATQPSYPPRAVPPVGGCGGKFGIGGTLTSQRAEAYPSHAHANPYGSGQAQPQPQPQGQGQAHPFPAAPSGGASPLAAAPLGYHKPPTEKKGFLKRMGTKKMSDGVGRLWRGPNGGAAEKAAAAAQAHAQAPTPAEPYPTYSANGNGYASAPAPAPAPAAAQQAPPLAHGHSYITTSRPGVPPLAPVADSSLNGYGYAGAGGSPPVPPKQDGTSPYLTPSPFDNGYRASVQSTASGDPYGGLDDETDAGTETERDVDGAEVGEVLFRGSQSFPDGLDAAAQAAEAPYPPRHASLPDSPKPDAEVPYDPHDPRFPSARYASGASQFSQRVAGIVGLYEQRERDAAYPGAPAEGDVRLTQYGFGPESAAAGGEPARA
ncbi:hypothetical protein JCM10450v2_000509 [Rhodotorula kratochvilovae]